MSNSERHLPFSIRNSEPPKIKRQLSDQYAWVVKEDNCGNKSYYNRNDGSTWMESVDESGNRYFYEETSKKTLWSLPHFDNSDLTGISAEFSEPKSTWNNEESLSSFSSESSSENGDDDASNNENTSNPPKRPASFAPKFNKPKSATLSQMPPLIQQNGKLDWSNISKDHISGPINNKICSERRANIHRTKYSENGKTVSKKWHSAHLVLLGPKMYIYRDQKASLPKPNLPDGKPEIVMDIANIQVTKASSEHTSKQNTIYVESFSTPGTNVVYLLNFSKPVECQSWEYALNYSKQLDKEQRFSEKSNRTSAMFTFPGGPSSNDQTSIINFLKDFFRNRSSREQLIERGIIKNEPVFGSSLEEICQYEGTEVPTFVCRLVKAVELRGINSPGIYRMSGNTAKIQVLRMEVDNYKYNLNSEKWDFDVLTGSLKLFFRELRVPLFSSEIFQSVSKLLKKESINYEEIIRILKTMPKCHFKTATVLFHHLYRIINEPDNKMTSDNLAIVFGPNLMHNSETVKEKAYLHIARQNTFIEQLLSNTPQIFGEPVDPPVQNFMSPS